MSHSSAPERATGAVITDWRPEDPAFWQQRGQRIASRNLWISVPCLLLAFCVWMLFSAVAVNLPKVGFNFTTDQLFMLTALPSVSGALLRVPYSFMVPIFGGRRWTAFSTGILIIPCVWLGFAVQDTSTPYSVFIIISLLCGFAGANFASSMANISFFFPKQKQGGALGLNGGPLLVALLVAPYGRTHIALFSILAFVAILVMIPICRWYKAYLSRVKWQKKSGETHVEMPLSLGKTVFSISILLTLIFSKYIYMASLNSYYTFYLIHKFGVSVQTSQICLFVFLIATAMGTLAGGPIGDKIGRKYVIWGSILGAAPFSLLMPHVGFVWTIVLSFCVGLVLSSAFPAILLYAQELLPYKLGLISGLFFGFAFGVAGIASAVLGNMADHYGIEAVYNVCGFMPLLGLVTWFLPNLKKK